MCVYTYTHNIFTYTPPSPLFLSNEVITSICSNLPKVTALSSRCFHIVVIIISLVIVIIILHWALVTHDA